MVDEFAPDPMDDAASAEDRPNVTLHPPTALFFALIAGYVIRLFAGGRLPAPRALSEGLGGLMIIVALGLVLSSVQIFAEKGQGLRPATPASQLFQKGPYKFSRNPIYLAMVVFGAGFGVATSNVWIIATTAILGAIFHFFVILPEERYLARRFGDEYAAYKARVRRWI
ncbi:MAG: isoprenylcysteine carboxylmethyltransferase family protein [Parvularculaceae bacterium]|nr:isoprenylcysteine carboxylmethyltransferase family protein [Parvularculaceae bacterium]